MNSTMLSFAADYLLPLPYSLWHDTYAPVPILVTLHALHVTLLYRKCTGNAQVPPLQGIISVVVLALGGSTMSAILLGKAPSWLPSNAVLPTYAAVYYTVSTFPTAQYALEWVPLQILKPILYITDALVKANSICSSGVDGARFTPGLAESWVAAVLCGTLCGCGGVMCANAFKLTSPKWQFDGTPSFISQPSFEMKASLFVASTYTVLTSGRSWWQLLGMEHAFARNEGRVVTFLLMMVLNMNKIRIEAAAEAKAKATEEKKKE